VNFSTRFLLPLMILLLGSIGNICSVYGHALQPGYLELQRVEDEQYQAIWKVPTVRERPMAITAKLPEQCENRIPTQQLFDGNAFISRWTTKCNSGLEGGVIQIDGLEKTTTDVLVQFEFEDGTIESRRLTPENPSFTIPQQPGSFEVVKTYLVLGIDHILSGIDHLLFVLALILLVKGLRSLIATITAFTIAHSLTLVAATLGFVHVPVAPTEAVIALSIVFVAAEIINSHRGRQGMAGRYPWRIAFVFGLLHGLGFAGALAEIGLPQSSIPLALLFFNLGIEIGQLLFVAVVLATVYLFQQIASRIDFPDWRWTWVVPPYVIGSLAVYWVIERMTMF